MILALAGSSLASAQATRTWISGVGDDVNPCSRTAPCKTWAGAISKTATAGEIDNLDTGAFGALTITKSITIDGNVGGIGSSLVSGTNGFTINAAGAYVVLRNLEFEGINSGLSGISIIAAAAVHIENVKIHDFVNYGINVTCPTYVTVDNVTIQGDLSAAVGSGIGVTPASGMAFVEVDNTRTFTPDAASRRTRTAISI